MESKCSEAVSEKWISYQEKGKGSLRSNIYLEAAPHATTNLSVTIADQKGEYACYAGMWWTPENKLAYMEPLCIIGLIGFRKLERIEMGIKEMFDVNFRGNIYCAE